MSNEQEANGVIKEELETFMPEDGVYKTTTGYEIPLPKITWKREKVIFKKVGELFDSVEEVQSMNLDTITSSQVTSLVGAMLRSAPDVITTLASQITGLEEEEVDEQLDAEDLARLLVPFFSERVQTLMQVVQEGIQ